VFAKTASIVILTALTTLATYAVTAALGPDWTRFAPATCLATHCFCEIPRTGQLILQPANSWSSFGFVAVGFWIMLVANRRSAHAPFTGLPALWFALTAIVIGIGSFLLHATLTLWGQFWDVVGMYLFSAFTLTWAFRRWRALGDSASVLLYLALCAVLIGMLLAIPETRRWLFAAVLIADIAIELTFARPRRAGVEVRWYVYGIGLQVAAFAIWILDLARTWCDGASLIQGHAAWHLLNAAALWCAWRYYRSERISGSVLDDSLGVANTDAS
jgi:Ceramidase